MLIFVQHDTAGMEESYLDILKDWETRIADPAVYEGIDVLFPEFSFRRVQRGSERDHWASRYKMDLTLPRIRNAEKTVVYRSEMRFREQGNWSESVSVMDRIIRDQGLSSIYEAYRYAAERLGLSMPKPDSKDVADALSRSQRRTALLETLRDYFCWNLENNRSRMAASVRGYLKSKRGFTLKQASALHLGFVPDWSKVIRYITIDRKFGIDELDEACGVRNAEGYTSVGKHHVLSIPYVCGGVLKGFLFRRTDDSREGPKYIATANLDRKSAFFNISANSGQKEIVIVEGEMDALKADAEGIAGAVAVGGSEISGDRRRQVEDAFRRGVRKMTLCLDLDPDKDAPRQGNLASRHQHLMKTIHTIKDVDPDFEEIYVAPFREPADPDEFIRNRGADAFRAMLSEALPYWVYLYRYKEGLLQSE